MRKRGCNVSRWTCSSHPHGLQRDSTSCGVFALKVSVTGYYYSHFFNRELIKVTRTLHITTGFNVHILWWVFNFLYECYVVGLLICFHLFFWRGDQKVILKMLCWSSIFISLLSVYWRERHHLWHKRKRCKQHESGYSQHSPPWLWCFPFGL